MSNLRLWEFISFPEVWQNLDTSILDEIAPSWFSRREILLANSKEYEEFINRLKRKHAIETGIVERMYDIDRGVTETLINEGFISSLINHGDTNIEKTKLLNHLQDHLNAVDFVFDIVKDDRPLTKGFICELHQLMTLHQDYAEGRDPYGNKTKIPLIKGRFKERENNPTREDGTIIMYCPPEHVDAEMDKLIEIYKDLIDKNTHPLIIASWIHHAFSTIHPFQDGNGRVVRLIASLILIKNNYFPITILREDAKIKYINALEKADKGEPQHLVSYFAEIERRNIEEALNIKEVSSTSLIEVTTILKQKIEKKRTERKAELDAKLEERRMQIFKFCSVGLNKFKRNLETEFGDSIQLYIDSGRPNDASKQGFYFKQIVNYAKTHQYFFNSSLPNSYLILGINMNEGRKYKLGISIHHYGYENSTVAIGGFLEYEKSTTDENGEITVPLYIKPHIISINDDVISKEKNIQIYIENILTIAIAQIASEF